MKKDLFNKTHTFQSVRNTLMVFLMLFLLLSQGNGLFAQENAISFLRSQVTGLTVTRPTSLQFGPDGRLYVAQVNGLIRAYTLARTAPGQYAVTATENINLVQNILNHNDDGTPNPNVRNRQVLGILVKGTAQNPIIYASSNDPRTGGGNGDLNLDTNSGIISKLFKNAQGQWEKIDLIRGLPKSEHNHATNGLQLDETTNTLYIAQGGHANKGAPSHELAWLPEFAYSAAILEVDLDAIEAMPVQGTGNARFIYDLPTLRGTSTPFGGDNGFNQAILVQGGPVQVYAVGFRNAYDIVLSESGKLYTWDNSSNANWGVPPIMRTADNLATNITERDFNNNVDNVQATHYKINDNLTYYDPFHYISHKGYYAGNPNPTRANPAINTFDGLSPVPEGFDFGFGFDYGFNTASGLENNFLHSGREGIAKQNSSLFGVMGSTNGIAEYKASNFNNAMKGDIIGASFNGILYRVALNADGTDLDHTIPHNGSGINGVIHLADGFGTWNILDVAAQSDTDLFPGTIWIAEYTQNKITVLEPNDFNECLLRNPADFPNEDFDNDGFTNQDEIDNGTDPCSPASIPNDWDGDLISDLNDPDDDNDGILDELDAFALDNQNGTNNFIPVLYEWEATNSELAGYILNSGFSGLMINNQDNYSNLYDIDNMTVIGTGGLFTVSNTTSGTALGSQNNQDYGFQFGVNVGDYPGNYTFYTVAAKPFENLPSAQMSNQNMGLHIGTGDQFNYLKILTDVNNGLGGIRVVYELNDEVQINALYPADILGKQNIHLYLMVDKATNAIQPAYAIEEGAKVLVGSPIVVPAAWLSGVVATGVVSTAGSGAPIGATWEFFRVIPTPSTSAANIAINSGNQIASSTTAASSFRIANSSAEGQKITQVVIDLSTSVFPDMVFDPANAIQDKATAQPFSIQNGASETGFVSHQFANPLLGDVSNGYTQLILTFNDFGVGKSFEFSLDTDPLSIKGTSPDNETGRVSGLELIGSTASVVFDDGSGHIGQLFKQDNQLGSSHNLFNQSPQIPVGISALDINSEQAEVSNPNQSIRITGANSANVKLLVLEGGLFTEGVPEGGFNLQPYHANRLLQVISEQSATLNNNGFADLNITLERTDLGNIETGIHYLMAVVVNPDGSTSQLSNILKIKLLSGPPFASYRINTGGAAFTSVEGADYTADAGFTTPSTAFTAASTLEIENTQNDVLYRSERYGNNFNYNLNVNNGNYQVILHFAEIYFGVNGQAGGVGSRIFHVNLEGQRVLSDFDIFSQAGGAAKAIQRSFYVNVADGQLNINFQRVVDNAKISAIEVIPVGSNTPPVLVNPLADYTLPYDPDLANPFQITVPQNAFSDLQDASLSYTATLINDTPLPSWISFDPSTATFSGFASQYQVDPNFIDIKVTAFDAQGLSVFDVFRITLVEPTVLSTFRINTGKNNGDAYTSTTGDTFINDTYVTGGTAFNHAANLEIANTDDDVLYRTERYGASTYNIPVANGAYKVVLHFSENYFDVAVAGGVGSRRFHVDMESVRRLTNFDIFEKAGGSARAIQEEFYITVADELLTIQFRNVTNNALINAIEIIPFEPTFKLRPQPIAQVLAGVQNRMMMRVEIPNFNQNAAQSFTFSTEGTSQTENIERAKLYYTGLNDSFSNPQLISILDNPQGNFTFNGFAQMLEQGINYFWLVYDVAEDAENGNNLGAAFSQASLTQATLTNDNPLNTVAMRSITQVSRSAGKALNFDGVNDFLTLSEESKFDFTNQVTVEAWVKITAFDRAWQAIVTKGNNSWRLHRNNETNLINFAINNGTSTRQVNSTTEINDGKWHHIAGVYTGTQLQIYIDGVLEGTSNVNQVMNNNHHPVMIGANAAANNRFFNGHIDEVRIWGIARTQAQIRENMHLTLSGRESGLVSYLQLNEETSTMNIDLVGELEATWSAGMQEANRMDATLPVAGGLSARANGTANQGLHFGETDVRIQFGATAPMGEVVVSKLENTAPALIDPAGGAVKHEDYWVINNFGNKDNLSEMTLRFYLPDGFLINNNTANYLMYKRASNADTDAWQSFEASAINTEENYLEFGGITSFSQIVIAQSNAPLPIRLLSFEAQRLSAEQAQLKWTTASEENNAGFEIEKSQDALHFEKIAWIDGAGNSIERLEYQYIDRAATSTAYYRLKQVDFDGTFTYSNVVMVEGTSLDFVRIYPNPIQDNTLGGLVLEGSEDLQTQQKTTLRVLTQTGKLILQQQGTLEEIQESLKNQAVNWVNGLYLLQFQTEQGKVFTLKLIKQ